MAPSDHAWGNTGQGGRGGVEKGGRGGVGHGGRGGVGHGDSHLEDETKNIN